MKVLDIAFAVAVACVASAVTLTLLAPSFGMGETARSGRCEFASVSEEAFEPPRPKAALEPVPTIVESESAQPTFAEEVENAVWSAPELSWGAVAAEDEPEPAEAEIGPQEASEASESASAQLEPAEPAEPEPSVDPSEYRDAGVTVQGGTRYTWDSSHEPGGEVDAECEADADGVFRDSDGYIVVASGDMEMGDVVETPLGDGKVYDRCPTSGVIDVYTDWEDR